MYITREDVIQRYPIIETWGLTTSDITSDMIFYSEIEINGRLRPTYVTPFSEAPPTVKDLCIDLVYARLILTRNYSAGKDLYNHLSERIKGLVNGSEVIFTGSGTAYDPSEGTVWSNTMDYKPSFSMLDAEDAASGVDINETYNEQHARRR